MGALRTGRGLGAPRPTPKQAVKQRVAGNCGDGEQPLQERRVRAGGRRQLPGGGGIDSGLEEGKGFDYLEIQRQALGEPRLPPAGCPGIVLV